MTPEYQNEPDLARTRMGTIQRAVRVEKGELLSVTDRTYYSY
jgi:hypothetical protein